LIYPSPDFVADGSDVVDVLACGVVEVPVFVAFAGIVGAAVAAAHGDDHIGGFDGVCGEDFGLFGGDVDALFSQGLDGYGVDLVGGFGAGRADFDTAAREMVEVAGGHLGAAGVVDANEQNGRLVCHRCSLSC
jgi:hypothetical protein